MPLRGHPVASPKDQLEIARRCEIAIWLIAAVYLLLAAVWQFSPGVFPHRPAQSVPLSSSHSGPTFDRKGIPPSSSDSERLLGLALAVCCLGLLQTRGLGERSVPWLMVLFLVLSACAVVGFWFLSLHRGSLSDRDSDALARSISWACFGAGLIVGGLNVFLALVRKRSA